MSSNGATGHTDLRTYTNDLIAVTQTWDVDTLCQACRDLNHMDQVATVAGYVFATEIQHRLHNKPAPTFDGFRATGLGGW